MRKLVFALVAVMAFANTAIAAPNVIKDGEYVICEIHTQDDAIEINEAPPINRVSEALDEVDAQGNELEYMGLFRLTFYCPCRRCNGKWGAIDAKGNALEWGTVAVDKNVIPLGTKLVIDGYDMIFTARDTGSGVNGNHIDVFVPVSHSEALRMPQGSKAKVWKYIER